MVRASSRQFKRKTILDGAARVFARKGYYAASVIDIAEESGLPEGSLYYHMESKEELLFEILVEGAKRVALDLERIARREQSAVIRLTEVIQQAVHFTCSDPYAPLALSFNERGGALTEEHRKEYVKWRDRCEAAVRKIVREGSAAGEFPETDSRLATLLWMGAIASIRRWYNPEGPNNPDKIAAYFAQSMIRALTCGNADEPATIE